MFFRTRAGSPAARKSVRRSLALPGAFERLEAKFTMDGDGVSIATPLAPRSPSGGEACPPFPVEWSSPMPFGGTSAALGALGDCESTSHKNGEAGVVPPKPAAGDQSSAVPTEESAPEADAKFEFPNIPSSPTDSPGPGWFWNGEDLAPGSPRGQWEHPDGRKLHPDLDHPLPKGPHWGVTFPGGNQWDFFPDSGKWVPAKPLNPKKPGFDPPAETTPDPKPVPRSLPKTEPAPMPRSPLIPFWMWPAIPPSPVLPPPPAAPAFVPGLPLFIIPIFPKGPDGIECA